MYVQLAELLLKAVEILTVTMDDRSLETAQAARAMLKGIADGTLLVVKS